MQNEQKISAGESNVSGQFRRASVGAVLAERREDKGLSLDDLHQKTLIPLWKLEALEKDDFEQLGSQPFVVGYISQLAKLLGAEPSALVSLYKEAQGIETGSTSTSSEFVTYDGSKPKKRTVGLGRLWSPWAILLIVAVWFGTIWWYKNADETTVDTKPLESSSEDSVKSLIEAKDEVEELSPVEAPLNQSEPEKTTAIESPSLVADSEETEQTLAEEAESAVVDVQPTPAPEVVESETEESPSSQEGNGKDLLSMSFSEACWVEVVDVHGKKVFAKNQNKGDNLQLFGDAPFSVMLGNSRAVELSINGRRVSTEPRGSNKTLRLLVNP